MLRPRSLRRLLRHAARRSGDLRFPADGDPVFVALTYDDASEIGLGMLTDEPAHGVPQRPASGHRIELCVYVDDLDETYDAARRSGVDVVTAPADMPWVCGRHGSPTPTGTSSCWLGRRSRQAGLHAHIEVGVLMPTGRLAGRRFASRAEAEAWARPEDGERVVEYTLVCECSV